MNEGIYLDYNASTPLAPEVVAAMLPFLRTAYGNPSNLHWAGLPARDAVDRARSQVAALLCCDATEIVFTSGGTEANNQAIKGLFLRRIHAETLSHHYERIEHPAVLEPCRFLESLGAEVTRLSVDQYGLVDPDDVRGAMRPHTALISIMHANNEVGTIQPLSAIAAIAREHGVLCHTDAAQTAGKISVDVEALGVDLLSIAGHKCYGPKGVGALFVREESNWNRCCMEQGTKRDVGLELKTLWKLLVSAACELALDFINDDGISQLRDLFWRRLQAQFGDRVVLNGHPEQRLPNTLNVSFLGHDGNEILAHMSNICASTGSACHAGSTHISPVLEAMGVATDVGSGAVRFSLGRCTTQAELDTVVESLLRFIESGVPKQLSIYRT